MTARTDNAPPGAAPALDYQSGLSVRRRRRRSRIFGAVAVVTLVALCAWQGPGVYRRAERAYWQRQVANYRAPPDTVVYEEDPDQWPALLGRPGYFQARIQHPFSPAVGHSPAAVTRFLAAHELSSRGGDGLVFAHALRSPSGNQRVVFVWLAAHGTRAGGLDVSPEAWMRMDFRTGVWDGTSLHLHWAQPWVAPDDAAEKLTSPLYARLCAGQPDPADPSHFTVAFEMREYFDVIDGYLRDDDTVVLRPRGYDHPDNPK